MFTDAHCHIYSEYYQDIDELLNKSKLSNVNKWINNGTSGKTNKEVLELADKYDGMYVTLGIHPEEVANYKEEDITFIEDNIKNKKVIAIGEIGLDYHYTKDNKEEQIILFEKQLKLAEKYGLPVVVHSREATQDTIDALKKYKVVGLIHSFSGSIETARIYIKMGYLLGINGVITFKNANLKDVFKDISNDNIVLETDSPYLTPEPFRGKQNDPSNILTIARFVADLKMVSLEELSKTTEENINRLFHV